MHTGKRDPLQLPEHEHYDRLCTQRVSRKLITFQNKFFSALNSSNFATIDYLLYLKLM